MNSAGMEPDLIRGFTPLVRAFITIQWFATGSIINTAKDVELDCNLLAWIHKLTGD